MRNFSRHPIGVHPEPAKHTAGQAVKELFKLPLVKIPMNMQIGPGAKPCVAIGDKVCVGQVIGEPIAPMSVPIHASISGEVTSISVEMQANSQECEVIEIKSDGKMTLSEDIKIPEVNNFEDFIAAVRASGLVGLGGAGFPTHIKLNPPADKKIDILLVNGMECEPYITSDDRTVRDHSQEILDGIKQVLHWCKIPEAIIGMEDNTPEAFEVMKNCLNEAENQAWAKGKVKLQKVKATYPQGAEKVMIANLTNRQVPSGGLPHDVGCLVMNVGSIKELAKFLATGHPLTSRLITLDGPALNRSGLYRVPIGARISDILDISGGLCKVPAKIIMGGPMMGVAVTNVDSPIIKMNNSILVFDEESAKIPPEAPCINCGRCANHCPMNLMPTHLDRYSRVNKLEELEQYAIWDCIECGSCSYICPARRHIVQNIRVGKAALQQAKAKAKAAAEKAEQSKEA